MNEEWEEVYGFDILYEVSNFGRLRTKHHGKLGYLDKYRYIELRENNHGYMNACLKGTQKKQTVYIHRLVAQAFVPNPNGYNEVNHKDENKKNNKSENLEWCEHIYNCNYGTRNTRTATKRSKAIRCIETGIVYESVHKAAEVFDVGVSAIGNCLKGRSKTCAGYTWEYVS